MIEPIDESQRQLVLAQTQHYINRAGEICEYHFDQIPVLFDLKGGSAGMFRVSGSQREIRYNPWIFAKYFEENLSGTVPHEVAHYIVHELYGNRRVKPHGQEWLTVMQAFGADPEVTFKLDLEGIPRRRQRTHNYRCDCRLHEVSSTRHNRVLKGRGQYLCRYCEGRLVYAG